MRLRPLAGVCVGGVIGAVLFRKKYATQGGDRVCVVVVWGGGAAVVVGKCSTPLLTPPGHAN